MLALLILDNARVHRSQREAKFRLAEALVEQARAIRLTGQAGQSREAVRLLREAGSHQLPPELAARLERTFIAALAQPDVQVIVPDGISPISDFMHIAFDPDFQRCVRPGLGGRFALAGVTGSTDVVSIPRRLNEADQVLGFSPDGRFVAFRRRQQTEVWDTQSGEFCLTTNGSLGAGAFHPDTGRFARGEAGGALGLYELPSGQRSGELPRSGFGDISAVAWTADGTRVVVGSTTGVMEAWRIGDTAPLWRRNLEGGVIAIAVNSPRDHAACLTRGDHLFFLELRTGRTVNVRVLPVDESTSAAYNADGSVLAVGHQNDGVWLLDGGSGAILLRNPARTWRVGFSRDGRRIGPVWERNHSGWLEYTPSKILRRLQPDSSPQISSAIVFSPDGRWLGAAGAASLQIWETETGRRAQALATPTPFSADWSERSGALAVATTSGLLIWPASSGKAEPVPPGTARTLLPGHELHCVRFSRCGRWLAVADPRDQFIRVLDAKSWNEIASLPAMRHPEWCEFSADGATLVASSEDPPDRRIWKWDGQKQWLQQPASMPTKNASLISYSPDGRYCVDFGEDLRLTPLYANAPERILPLANNNVQFAVALRGDGQMLAATQHDTEIHLVDPGTGQTRHILEGLGTSRIRSLAFDPTGRRLAALRERGEVQLWDLRELEAALKTLPLPAR